jgi:hypothetical protein
LFTLGGLLLGRDESTNTRRQEFSLFARESNVRKGSNRCFFVVFYPKIWTWHSKKARGGQREGNTKREGLFDERFLCLVWFRGNVFSLFFFFFFFFFVRCLFFDVLCVCSRAALRVQKIVLVLVFVLLHY